MRARSLSLTAALLTLVLARHAEAQRSLPADVFARVLKGVVRVRSQSCSGPDRNATGFVVDNNGMVVTARHVVAGCASFSLYPTDSSAVVSSAFVSATLQKMRTAADVALLHADAPLPQAEPLGLSTSRPAVGTALAEVGYFLDSNGVYD